jgi:hypothetical protein
MTTERKQLELAARACGYELQWESDGTIQNRINRPTIPYECQGMISATDWNPLKDDGDCARMEAELDIDVLWEINWVTSAVYTGDGTMCELRYFKDHNGDKNAARRAASVAVAAEIGRLT